MRRYLKIVSVVTLALFAFTASGHARDMIQIKGSDTLINLVQRLAEEYMEKNPGKAIAVTGGGSGTGIAALINGKCDVANASRNMKPKEETRAVNRGIEPKRVVIALDGLSVIVNGQNQVSKLTLAQIGKIFRGETTNWKQLGGPDKPITLYGRQSNSGTFVLFRDMVLKGDYSPRMKRMNGNSQIVEAVKADLTGMGYVGVGYVRDASGINVLSVAAEEGADYASPLNTADVKSGKYPIARPLNQYLDGAPQGAVRDFLEFELGPEGQKIVEEEGFFPLPKEYVELNEKNVGI
ncbi:MAG: phosphate ABC transporter substrate-binding protein PstS family protein [Candidatus Omnitrophica bacterium]|nr:phosphate ABC transporter substrate-binding protein PstS family protein [Candidatus Omnitrophota bacterium]